MRFFIISLIWLGVAHTVTTSTGADEIGRVIESHFPAHSCQRKREMAIQNNIFAVRLAFLVALALTAAFLPAYVSAESTKTVELDIRPGGTVYTFTQTIVRNFDSVFPVVKNITLRFNKPHQQKCS